MVFALTALTAMGVAWFLTRGASPPPPSAPLRATAPLGDAGDAGGAGAAAATAGTGDPAARLEAPPDASSEARAGDVVGREPPDGAADDGIRTRLRVPWGAAVGSLGRDIPDEGAPLGPMAFAVSDDGALWVLDNVNARVQGFPQDGPPRVVPLPDANAHDLAVAADGALVVLDRSVGRSVSIYEPDGALRAGVPLEGPGVPTAGGVTGVFARDDGIWVEVGHERQVRVAAPDGSPGDRRVLGGRPQPGQGRVVTAHVQRPDRVIVLTRPADDPQADPALLAEVAFPLPVHHVVGLGFDAAGAIYLGVFVARFAETAPYAVVEEYLVVVALSPDGAEMSRRAVPAEGRPEEQLRSLFVTDDGIVYHLQPTDDGVVVREVVP